MFEICYYTEVTKKSIGLCVITVPHAANPCEKSMLCFLKYPTNTVVSYDI